MAWTLYKEIKYDTLGIPPGDLTDFPVIVAITADTDIASELGSGGGIKFTSADGSVDLKFGLYPSTNLAAGTVLARVKTSVSASASVGNGLMRIYYSASESTTEDKAGTVSNSYVLFMPMEEDPSGSAPQMRNWVTDTLIGTSNGTMTSGDLVDGQVGSALDCDGSDDYIAADSIAATFNGVGYPITLEALARPASSHDGSVLTVSNDTNFSRVAGEISCRSTGSLRYYTASGTGVIVSGGSYSANNWVGIAAVSSSTTSHALYVNGSSAATSSSSAGSTYSFDVCRIGRQRSGGSFFDPFSGRIDEVRISNVARSANWLAYSHTVDFNKASLWTLGSEQGGGGGITGDFYIEGSPFAGYVTCAGVADQLPIQSASGSIGQYVDWDGTAGRFYVEGGPGYVDIA